MPTKSKKLIGSESMSWAAVKNHVVENIRRKVDAWTRGTESKKQKNRTRFIKAIEKFKREFDALVAENPIATFEDNLLTQVSNLVSDLADSCSLYELSKVRIEDKNG